MHAREFERGVSGDLEVGGLGEAGVGRKERQRIEGEGEGEGEV